MDRRSVSRTAGSASLKRRQRYDGGDDALTGLCHPFAILVFDLEDPFAEDMTS